MIFGWALPTFFIGMSDKNMEINLRPAKPEDAKAVCDVHIASIRILCAKDYTSEQIAAWVSNCTPENYRIAIEKMGETMFVARKGEAIIGFSALFESEIRAIYVHPNYTRQRVGTLLLEALERAAVNRNIDKLKLSASINAKSFYESCGYQVIEYSVHTLPSGVKIPCVDMEKSLV